MNYGEKISQLRKSKGMTQDELGKILNVTYQAVSKWERNESLPDFDTMSQMAKYFQVPMDYFVDGGSNTENVVSKTEIESNDGGINNYIGMCTVCGRMLRADDAHSLSPKIICNTCAEIRETDKLREQKMREEMLKRDAAHRAQMLRGHGADLVLIISLVLSVACYAAFTAMCFIYEADREMFGAMLFFVPLAVFGTVHAFADFINDLRDVPYDGSDGYTRNLSLIVGAIFAVLNAALFLMLYFTLNNNPFFLFILPAGIILSFTFVSQYMWGGVIGELFSGGGFTFKLPGVIFSLEIESIVWMIAVKIFLGIVAVIVYVVTTLFMAAVAVLGSVFTFIPSVISKTVKDKKA